MLTFASDILEQQISQTKTRFARYGESGLLCGVDGLPHLIVDGDIKHAPEFVIPGIVFLYTTGWIGWAGRKYLQTVAKYFFLFNMRYKCISH